MNWYVVLSCVAAGLLQGVTGFGSGFIIMIVLPMYYSIAMSAGLSNAICTFLSIYIAAKNYKKCSFKDIIAPTIIFAIANALSIYLVPYINQALLKKIFGVFLIVLAVYYLFFSKTDPKKVSGPMAFVFFFVSGMCNGLFAIGGPLMMIYFLTKFDDFKVYYATIQTFFMVNNVIATITRIANGMFTSDMVPMILVSAAVLIFFTFLGNKVMDRLPVPVLKKLTYVIILLAGITNLI